jgi:uncharacterized membrane protein YjjB (DUF3815 family)
MDLLPPLQNGLWAGLFSASLALVFTAPVRSLPVVLAAGFAGRFSRDLLLELDVTLPMATGLAAFAATALAIWASREPAAVPVAAVTAVLPLSPTTIVFSAFLAAVNVFAADPAVAAASSADFTTNSLRAFVVTLAMAIGSSIALLVSRGRYE